MSVKRPDPVDVEVGHRIRIERLARGLSQTALANQLGVTFQQVQKYEKGVNRVGAGRLTKIAEVLGVPVGHVLHRQGNAGKRAGQDGQRALAAETAHRLRRVPIAARLCGDRGRQSAAIDRRSGRTDHQPPALTHRGRCAARSSSRYSQRCALARLAPCARDTAERENALRRSGAVAPLRARRSTFLEKKLRPPASMPSTGRSSRSSRPTAA